MTVQIAPDPKFTGFDNNGNKASGGKLFVYLAGTTTKTNSFTDSTGVTPNTNPVVLNTRGEADVWLTPGTAYKFVLSPSTDSDPPSNAFWTADGLNAGTVATLGTNTFTATQTFSPGSGAAIVVTVGGINEISQTLPSAATVAIGGAPGNYIFISDTTTITAFDTIQSGTERTLEFQGSLTLTNNSTSLILPGNANIVTQAGDTAIVRSEGTGNWRCISYQRANSGPANPGYLRGFIDGFETSAPGGAQTLTIGPGAALDNT